MIDWKETLQQAKKMYEMGNLSQAQFTDILHNALQSLDKSDHETIADALAVTDVPQPTAANTTLSSGT